MRREVFLFEKNVASFVFYFLRGKKNSLEIGSFKAVEEPDWLQEVYLVVELAVFEMAWKCFIEVFEVQLKEVAGEGNWPCAFYFLPAKLHLFSKIFSSSILLKKLWFFPLLILSPRKEHNSTMQNMIEGPILIIPIYNLSKSKFFNRDVVNNDIKIMTTFFLINKWEKRYIK